jgi:hypothetical protein
MPIDYEAEYKKIIATLPMDEFPWTEDNESIDWNELDPVEFRDNASAFVNAMELARAVELRKES